MQEHHEPQTSHHNDAPQPLSRYTIGHIEISQFEYVGGGTFEVPPISGEHLSVVLEGTNVMERRLDGQRQQGLIQPGDVTIVPRGATSIWTPRKGTATTLHVVILPDLWHNLAQTSEIDPSHIELRADFATSDGLIQHLTLALLQEAQSPSPDGMLYTQTLQQTLAMHLLRHYTRKPHKLEPLSPCIDFKRTRDYIEAHLCEDLSLNTLAALEGLSPFYFARQFKQVMGQPPHQYVILRRVERAQNLMKTTQLSLAQIAHTVGFANQSHLHRHFVRMVGVTPAQYRR
ncbi:MAG: AraC family transcriptional regulator [Chloroflexota bacterium]